jgi:hypothetical protein
MTTDNTWGWPELSVHLRQSLRYGFTSVRSPSRPGLSAAAADHKLLTELNAGLHPDSASSSRFVPAIRALRNYALKLLFLDESQHSACPLEHLPAGTIVDGELAALDSHGCPRFTLLQNFRRERARLVYFVFDILAHKGRELTGTPLSERRSLLRSVVQTGDCVAISEFTTSNGKVFSILEKVLSTVTVRLRNSE